MKSLRFGFLSALFVVFCTTSAHAQAASSPPQSLIGTWEVERVFIDPRPMGKSNIPDDPRFVGRPFVIEPNAISFLSNHWPHCHQKVWKPYAMTVRKLFADSLFNWREEDATVEVYEVPLDAKAKVTVYPICDPQTPRKHKLSGPWLAVVSEDLLVISPDNDALLFAKRRRANRAIVASFSCKSALTPTEKAICADVDLGLLDRSVAAAFELASEKWDTISEARCAQRRWLERRNKCGVDVTCLKGEMLGRTEHLAEISLFSLMSVDDDNDGKSCR